MTEEKMVLRLSADTLAVYRALVAEGEFVSILGQSGCGKSTLLRCLNGLEPTQSGRVRLGSETVAISFPDSLPAG